MAELTAEQQEMIAHFQSYQQQLQVVMMQKESLKLQEMETDKALEELNATKQESAYKIAGGIMVSKPVAELKKELGENKETVSVRLQSLDRSEEKITNKLKELQTKLSEVLK